MDLLVGYARAQTFVLVLYEILQAFLLFVVPRIHAPNNQLSIIVAWRVNSPKLLPVGSILFTYNQHLP